MKRSLLAVALGAAGVGGIVVASTALAEPVPAAAKNQPFFANAHCVNGGVKVVHWAEQNQAT
ncbi:hypothetical protein [Sphingobium sp. YC-XJ3]|uniref:hypothetical protein n=1 Tax=Sphingobium sp. YC-XJ3 TaxID=3024245 RepID=UPI00235E2AD9|nr:hypothetical protein [Sphingobium sp. YC-XJ3]WDA39372.1 hypothetical protein PO876_25195 [Sphingobium sp. YC-XJ3]